MASPTRTTQMMRRLPSSPLGRRDAISSSSACSMLSSFWLVQADVADVESGGLLLRSTEAAAIRTTSNAAIRRLVRSPCRKCA